MRRTTGRWAVPHAEPPPFHHGNWKNRPLRIQGTDYLHCAQTDLSDKVKLASFLLSPTCNTWRYSHKHSPQFYQKLEGRAGSYPMAALASESTQERLLAPRYFFKNNIVSQITWTGDSEHGTTKFPLDFSFVLSCTHIVILPDSLTSNYWPGPVTFRQRFWCVKQ